jgi:hypothetical protein
VTPFWAGKTHSGGMDNVIAQEQQPEHPTGVEPQQNLNCREPPHGKPAQHQHTQQITLTTAVYYFLCFCQILSPEFFDQSLLTRP